MREIKFRAWDTEKEVMSEVNYLSFDETDYPCIGVPHREDYVPLSFFVLLQCTGLKDSFNTEEYFDYLVKDTEQDIWRISDGASAVLFKNVATGEIKYFWDMLTHQVIGNIYENKELLQRES